jgi:hypothetical protein
LDPHEDDIGSEETMNAEEAEEAEEEFNYEFEEDPYLVAYRLSVDNSVLTMTHLFEK